MTAIYYCPQEPKSNQILNQAVFHKLLRKPDILTAQEIQSTVLRTPSSPAEKGGLLDSQLFTCSPPFHSSPLNNINYLLPDEDLKQQPISLLTKLDKNNQKQMTKLYFLGNLHRKYKQFLYLSSGKCKLKFLLLLLLPLSHFSCV